LELAHLFWILVIIKEETGEDNLAVFLEYIDALV
jgi:hypothetical protein